MLFFEFFICLFSIVSFIVIYFTVYLSIHIRVVVSILRFRLKKGKEKAGAAAPAGERNDKPGSVVE